MSDPEQPLTLGTAGHIDHGKSALVDALTGSSSGSRTDRLPEEQARGMTIALGYAPLRLPAGRVISVIDVPGHERFVRTMVSGATGCDLFLLAIAADDGVMPQTREHLRILRVLGVRQGLVAVTKTDLADPAPAVAAARELLADAPIVACSVRTGEGIEQLAVAIERVVRAVPSRAAADGSCVLHVDRVFSVRGAGTVITGTLWSGAVARGDRLQLLPDAHRVRVRAVQVHDRTRDSARAGQRVAVNITGVPRERVRPGDVLAAVEASLHCSYRFDAALQLEEELRDGERVQVHHGTRESPARAVPLGEDYWQLRLERQLVLAAGDRFVVRGIASASTLGGGVVIDPAPRRHGASGELVARLRRVARGEPVEQAEEQPAPAAPPAVPPAAPPTPAPATTPAACPAPAMDRRSRSAAQGRLDPAASALEQRLRAAGPRPPSEAELGVQARHLPALRAAGRAVRVGRSMYAHVDAIEQVRASVERLIAAEGGVTIARLRDELHISRRYAQALLEHLDAARVTRRLPDDRRVLRRAIGAERRS